MIHLVVDNRVRVRIEGDHPVAQMRITELKSEHEHPNPEYQKAKFFGFKKRIPRQIVTWQGDTEVSFPRGSLSKVRAALGPIGARIDDRRTLGDADLTGKIPKHQPPSGALWPHQEMLASVADAAQNALVRSAAACLVGETMIGVSRASKGSRMRLDHVVHMFNGGISSGKTWDPDIPTLVRAPLPDGTVRLRRLVSATRSGVRQTWRIWIDGGFAVCGTSDHRVLTPFGWAELGGLGYGDFVLVDESLGGRPIERARKARVHYPTRNVAGHPHGTRGGRNPPHRVPVHRLIAEARLNGMWLDEFVERVKGGDRSLTFIDPVVYAVHHEDRDRTNNALSNLVVLTHEEHRRVHAEDNARNIEARLVPRRVLRVERALESETFDLEIDEVSAFMANSVAVHNSGKTTAALALASRLNLPTLVVVHNANLFDQWITRCVKELGVPRSWVGIIRGPKRKLGPITIGMQKTLYGCAAEVAPAFGLVIVDEVHRSAARTFLEVVDQMTARYRVGVSDDERRSDGKEFLIYDMFGPVVGEASHDDLVRQGYVMDVAVRVVPTEFRADWYQKLEPNEKLMAYQRLMELMATNDARNAQAVRDVPLDVASGHQVILFVDRVEHALTLDRMMNARDIRSGFVVGEHPEESAETLRRFGDGRANVVFGTYQALGTGIDMPRVSRGVFVTPIANSAKGRSQFKQYRGRFARAVDGKAQPEVAYLWDRYVFGSKPLRHLCRWARDVRVEWRGRLISGREVLKEIEDDEAQRDDD